jgi:hypothetical protein
MFAPIFTNPVTQQMFEQKGFVVLDAGIVGLVNQMQGYIDQNFNFFGHQFYYSLMANNLDMNREIRTRFRQILMPFYEANFTGYRLLTESFMVKPANTNQELVLHQDWNFTDESQYLSLTVWIPLDDVDERNGTVFFLPGSHRWFQNFRSGSLPTGRIASDGDLQPHFESVTAKKGQVVVFHPAVFHGSYPNLSNQDRKVVTTTILPAQAPFLYYQKTGEGQVSIFDLDEDAFLRELSNLAMGGTPNNCPVLATKVYHHQMIGKEELMAHFATQDQ